MKKYLKPTIEVTIILSEDIVTESKPGDLFGPDPYDLMGPGM